MTDPIGDEFQLTGPFERATTPIHIGVEGSIRNVAADCIEVVEADRRQLAISTHTPVKSLLQLHGVGNRRLGERRHRHHGTADERPVALTRRDGRVDADAEIPRLDGNHWQPLQLPEPIELDDARVESLFGWIPGFEKIRETSRNYTYQLPEDEKFALWSNFRGSAGAGAAVDG